MIAWTLLVPALILFMAINLVIGCYVAILLGCGPPDWKTALNLVVRVTTLQDRLNAGRVWLSKKAPWADQFLARLRVPKPIIIVDVPEEEETAGETNETVDVEVAEPSEGISDGATEESLDKPESDGAESKQIAPEPP